MSEKKELQVAALENGTVIDHIPSDKLFTVVSLLDLQHLDSNITIGNNFVSKKLGKKAVEMPEELKGIVKCNNPKCITNNEPMTTWFHVIDKKGGIIKCHYCEKEQQIENIKLL